MADPLQMLIVEDSEQDGHGPTVALRPLLRAGRRHG